MRRVHVGRRTSGVVVALTVALIAPPAGASTGSETRLITLSKANEVGTVWTSEFGVARPVGLAFVESRGEFLVAGSQRGTTRVLRLGYDDDGRGVVDVPLPNPSTLTYDAVTNQIASFGSGGRSDVAVTSLKTTDKALGSPGSGLFSLTSPRSAAIDPSTGDTYLLSSGSTLTRVSRSALTRPRPIRLDGIGEARLLAFNAADGLLYLLDGAQKLHAVDRSGRVRTTYDMSAIELRRPSAMVFAPSTDTTDDPTTRNLFVATSGDGIFLGGVVELTLSVIMSNHEPTDNATLVRMTPTSAFNPGSPDPAGVVLVPAQDQLVIVDSEVDETTGAGWNNVNMWRTTRSGGQVGTGTFWGPNAAVFNGSTGFSREPTGAGYAPGGVDTLFVSDDSAQRVFVIKRGPDNNFGTSDDIVGSVNTGALGVGDTEDPTYDPASGDLFFLDGTSTQIYRVDPVDSTFGNGNDTVTNFDIGHLGPSDFEGLAFNSARGSLYVGARVTDQIFEISTSGVLMRTVTTSGISGLTFISGLAIAPASNGSGQVNFYIVDRAVDNGANPNENDGKLFEVSAPDSLGGGNNQAPIVSAGSDQSTTIPNPATLNGSVTDDGNPNPPGATTASWSQVSGPGTASFGNPNSAVTTATFPVEGTYVLRLTGSDSLLSSTDDVTVTVTGAGGQAPIVSAGSDQSVTMPNPVTLNGSVTDDGLPNPPGATTASWSQVSGPGTTTFGNPNSAVTTATFSMEGSYVLRLTGSDSILTASDDVTVTVVGAGGQPPVANAGQDLTIVLPNTAALNGSVTDDGLPNPPGATTASWSQVSGPGTTIFDNPNSAVTTATFPIEGTYVLRLTGSDSILSDTDDVTVTVLGPGGPFTIDVPVIAGSDDAEESSAGNVSLTSSDIELVFDGPGNQTVGLRFANIGIPQGAVILNAYVQFTVDEVNTGATNLVVQGHDVDNSATFTTANFNVSSRARTNQSVGWVPPLWPTVGASGVDQRTPALAPIIQEIISRPLWTSGNALSLIITGTGERTAEAFEGTADPTLHIEYQIGGTPPNQPPVADAGSDVSIVQPNSAALNGSVSDDGLPNPPATTTALWSTVSGPGSITFGNPNSAVTTATFTEPGTYVLRLTADDSDLTDTDDVTVTVVGPGGPFTLNIPITNGLDDVEERPNGTIARTGSDLELVVDTQGAQTVGLRFLNVTLPAGATITEAYIQFTQDEANSAAANVLVQGQASPNPLGFTTANFNVSSRPRTTNSTTWIPVPWTVNGSAGPGQRTPSLITVVQELIGQGGWASGNAMVFIFTGSGTRTAEAFEGTADPVLHIVYTT